MKFLLGPIICAGIWVSPESEAQDWGQVELTRVLLISDGARPSQRTKLAQNPVAAMAEQEPLTLASLNYRGLTNGDSRFNSDFTIGIGNGFEI